MTMKYDEEKMPFIDLGNGSIVRLESEEISDKCRETARIELRETEEIKNAAIEELKHLLSEETNLSVPIDDEKYYVKFLRPCHYFADSAFEKIKKFYRFKQKYVKYTDDLFPRTVRHVFEAGIVQLNPKRTQNGCRILVVHVSKWKTNRVHVDDIFRCVEICVEAAMAEPTTQVNGVVVMFDTEGLTMGHLWQISASFAAMMVHWVQECIGMRVKEIHITHNSVIFNLIFAIFKPFLNAKLRNRIHFHNKDMKSLHGFVDRECLRQRFDGTLDCAELDGSLLADLFEFHNKEYEIESGNGYQDKSKPF